MKLSFRFVVSAFLVCLAACTCAFAGTVDGTVKNGTTGKVVAGAPVLLLRLQGGMETVATTKTDAAGHYHIEQGEIGSGPMLVRVVYEGVNYHEPLTPGKSTVDVEVFEPTDKPDAVHVTAHAIILQPNGDQLMVGEEYTIENHTKPPVAYYNPKGTFDFSVPENGKLGDVSAWSAAGMPVVQQTIEKGKDRAVVFAFRPGENGVRLSYTIPYSGNKITLRAISPYAADHLLIAAPPGVQVSAPGVSAGGTEQGFDIYGRDQVAANAPLDISVSGTAPPPSADNSNVGDNTQDPSVNSRVETNEPASVLPARLDNLKWVLAAGFGAIFLLGAFFVFRRPEVADGIGSSNGLTDFAGKERHVASKLRDQIFRLELRRQAGSISKEEYAQQRERVEKSLRSLVKG